MSPVDPPPVGWGETRRLIREDHARLAAIVRARFGADASIALHPGALNTAAFRVAHYLWRRGHRKTARLVSQAQFLLTGGEIHPEADIGPGLAIPHPTGAAILCKAGRNLTILSRAGTGMLPRPRDVGAGPGVPQLGDDCVLGPCNGVEGPWLIGDGVVLGTGVLVMQDVPSGTRLRAHRPGAPGEPPPRLPDRDDPIACPHASPSASWRDLVADMDAYLAQGRGRSGPAAAMARLSALLTNQVLAVALHRLAHFLQARGWCRLARAVALANRWVFRDAIHPASCVGGGWFLPHSPGVVFHAAAGSGLVMFAFTTVASDGNPWRDGPGRAPRLGRDVVLAANSCITGPATIGDDVRLAFSAHVHGDVGEGRLVVTAGCRPDVDDTVRPGASPCATSDDPVDPASDRAAIRADWERLATFEGAKGGAARLALRLSPAWVAVRLFRASRAAWVRGQVGRALALWKLNLAMTGADLRPTSRVGPGLLVPFPACVSLEGHAGRDLTMLAMSGIDADPVDLLRQGDAHLPRLGDGVTLGTHAGVVGAIRVGDGATLAPGARVTRDVPAGATCVHAPLRSQRRSRVSGVLSPEAMRPAPERAET